MSANEAEELREKVDALEAENERLRAAVARLHAGAELLWHMSEIPQEEP
jgi:hypothetical protein